MTLCAQWREPESGVWQQVMVWPFAERSSLAWMDRAEALSAARDWIGQFEARDIVIEEFADDGITSLGIVAECTCASS